MEKIDANWITLYWTCLARARDEWQDGTSVDEALHCPRGGARAFLGKKPDADIGRPGARGKGPAVARHWHIVEPQLERSGDVVLQVFEVRARSEHHLRRSLEDAAAGQDGV